MCVLLLLSDSNLASLVSFEKVQLLCLMFQFHNILDHAGGQSQSQQTDWAAGPQCFAFPPYN